MIIKSPTGLYKPILPTNGSGNFTFVISTQNPPRSPEAFINLPQSEELRREPVLIYNKEQKRVFAGELLFDITIPSKVKKSDGNRQYEVGQILDFVDSSVDSVDPYNLEILELRQDTKVIDYKKAGLDDSDYEELKNESLKLQNEITSKIAAISSQLKDNSSLISSNQAEINNSLSLYNNVVEVFGDSHSSAIKINNKLNILNNTKNDLLNERKSLQSELDTLRLKLNKIREVVR